MFEDAEGKLNLSVRDVGGELLVVSQFTLYGDAQQGQPPQLRRRRAAGAGTAALRARARSARRGRRGFGAHMRVSLVNDGPVTLVLEA